MALLQAAQVRKKQKRFTSKKKLLIVSNGDYAFFPIFSLKLQPHRKCYLQQQLALVVGVGGGGGAAFANVVDVVANCVVVVAAAAAVTMHCCCTPH